ncbi:Glycine cleavage system H protein [hydrothermal vent metagenome]|uniref:Glycine cleavage system H protein n=1 Tax=hydrothermal vent metagenome TaxID=652676 RepID=A0A1W1CIG0_9ZZZZ
MSEIRKDLQYTKTHEWVKDNGDGTWIMGITDNAQELLGDMVFVELPSIGDLFDNQADMCVVESVKAASDVYAPTNLEVLEVNESLDDTPEILNSDCYGKGWLIKFKGDVNGLMSSSEYETFIEEN